MKAAIRKRLPDFAAILVLFVLGMAVAAYILSNQRFNLPAWVPLLGKDFYELKAEFQTGQALTPGQGQTVNIAGVKVGEIAKVELVDGRAIVTMNLERKFAEGRDGRPAIYRDAQLLLRPKTGLKDMIIEVSPGTPAAGRVREGGTLPVANTLPDVNPDEVLATLDADTRRFLVLLLNGAGEGLRGNNRELASTLRRFEPTARDAKRLTELLVKRRANVRRTINNFQKLVTELGTKDDDIAQLVDSSNAVFQSFAAQEANLRATFQELPSALTTTQTGLDKADTLARELGPTLQALRPGARALGPSLRETRPFLRESIPIIRDQLRPFTRIATPIVAELRPALKDLRNLTPDLVEVFEVLNYALNEIFYDPPGAENGYAFYLFWANHLGTTVFSTQDAHGPIRRGLFLASCESLGLLNQVAATTPQLSVLVQLLNLPATEEVCPERTGANTRGAAPGERDGSDEDTAGPAGEGPAARRPSEETTSSDADAAPAPDDGARR